MQDDIPEKLIARLDCCEELQTHEVVDDCWSHYSCKGSDLGWRDFSVSWDWKL